jgi:predicted GNAT family N-acyltransferase
MPPLRFTVVLADWHADRAALQAVRRAVFIEEQNVPEALEWDELDARCAHVLACGADGTAIGTGRLIADGRIGRMAVLKEYRRSGVGSAILRRLIALAREARCATVRLHAQTHALEFYAGHGFEATGGEFMEAGIPHREMISRLEGLP